jgi:hemerythrin-like domain-containing protein
MEDNMALRCTDQLIDEHRLILRAVYVLQAMADQAKQFKMPAAPDVDRLLFFFRVFADDHHQAKEEAVLFPALKRAGQSAGALHQMMFEHEQERSLIEGLEDSLRTRNQPDFAYYGRRLADVLGTHIYKEDHILFGLVEKCITKETDAKLLGEMAIFDTSLRPGLYQEMSKTINALEQKYLGRAA